MTPPLLAVKNTPIVSENLALELTLKEKKTRPLKRETHLPKNGGSGTPISNNTLIISKKNMNSTPIPITSVQVLFSSPFDRYLFFFFLYDA
jgi:hypothetical protein